MWESILVWPRERTVSPLYGTYIISNILWNWKFFYVLFFQAQSALNVPKIEYIESKFLTGDVFSQAWHELYFFIPPIIFTFIIIKWVPRLTSWAYNLSVRDDFGRRRAFEVEKLSFERQQKDILSQYLQIKQEKNITQEKIELIMTDEERWTAEYEEFKKTPGYINFNGLLVNIYQNEGYVRSGANPLDPETYAVVDSLGLIMARTEYQISLTEKGKFFVKKYLADGHRVVDIPF